MATEIERGTLKRITATVTDSSDSNTDVDASGGDYEIYVEVTDTGTDEVKLSSSRMTRQSEGVYYYDWQTSEADRLGQYTIEITATLGGDTYIDRSRVELVKVS